MVTERANEESMTKTLEDNFRDWEADLFGFGYGTGEPHVIPAVKRFLELCDQSGAYDYRELEAALSPVVAWLLINALAGADILEYGTSPRHGWLTPEGKALREFIASKTAEQLVDLATDHSQDYIGCYPGSCNCGPNGYDAKAVCHNPFWHRPSR